MFSPQRSSSQTFLIRLGVAVVGMPLVFWFAYLVAPPSSRTFVLLFTIGLLVWLAICVGVRKLAHWLFLVFVMGLLVCQVIWLCVSVPAHWVGVRTSLIGAGILLIGVPLAVLASNIADFATMNSGLWFLAFWSILSELLTRNGRGMYIALHLANWFFFLGILSVNNFHFLTAYPIYLAIPVGNMLILLGLYRPVINRLALFPFMHHGTVNPADPKSSPE